MDFLGSLSQSKYAVSAGIIYESSPYFSSLLEDNQTNPTLYTNNIEYNKSTGFIESSFTYKTKKWQLQPSFSLKNMTQTHYDFMSQNKLSNTHFIVAPTISILFKPNKKSAFNASFSYDEIPTEEYYLLPNYVLTGNRNMQNSIVDLAFQQLKNTSVSYSYNDTYNFFTFLFSGNYSETNNDFFSRYNFSETLNTTTFFRLPYGNRNYILFLKTDKYIPFLESTLRITANYNYGVYKNIVNDSELRNNTSQFFNAEFFWKTAFDIPVNFQNECKISQSDFYSENTKINANTFFNNTSAIIYRWKKKLTAIVSLDYFLPNTQKKGEEYWFLDTRVDFFFSNKKYNFSIEGKNLLNTETFLQRSVSDYSISTFQTNLLKRYVMVSFSISF